MIMTDQQFIAGLVLAVLLYVVSFILGHTAYNNHRQHGEDWTAALALGTLFTFVGATALVCILIFNPIN